MAPDLDIIRKDFPPLRSEKPPVYFDNACTTLRPVQVVEAMNAYYYEHPSCHKRAVHAFGKKTSARYDSARETARDFINAKEAAEIVFTRNSTEGLNLVAFAFPFKEGDTVITTDLEHNSNTIPWRRLRDRGKITYRVLPVGPDGNFDLDRFRELVKSGARLVSVFSHSHVMGIASPLKEIVEIAHEHGAIVLVDAAQTALHEKIDVRALDIDFLVLSFHKMLGPSGMGLLYGKRELLDSMEQFLTGGETVEDVAEDSFVPSALPEKFEAGLQNYAGALGAEAAIGYLKAAGHPNFREHETSLNRIITEGILKLDKFHIIGPEDPARRGSIVNFYVDGMDSGEISILLDKSARIMTRSGDHCAHSWYRKYKIPPGLRASLSFYNTADEATLFVEVLANFAKYY